MEILTHIIVFILGNLYAFILQKLKQLSKYRKIIERQKIEIDFLKRELEEIESKEIFDKEVLFYM